MSKSIIKKCPCRQGEINPFGSYHIEQYGFLYLKSKKITTHHCMDCDYKIVKEEEC